MTYEDIYNKYYVRMPKIVGIIWGVLLALLGLFEVGIVTEWFDERYRGILEFVVGLEYPTSAYSALFVWWVVAFLIAYAIQFITKISISQKIVVVDKLTKIMENTQDK